MKETRITSESINRLFAILNTSGSTYSVKKNNKHTINNFYSLHIDYVNITPQGFRTKEKVLYGNHIIPDQEIYVSWNGTAEVELSTLMNLPESINEWHKHFVKQRNFVQKLSNRIHVHIIPEYMEKYPNGLMQVQESKKSGQIFVYKIVFEKESSTNIYCYNKQMLSTKNMDEIELLSIMPLADEVEDANIFNKICNERDEAYQILSKINSTLTTLIRLLIIDKKLMENKESIIFKVKEDAWVFQKNDPYLNFSISNLTNSISPFLKSNLIDIGEL